MHRPLFSRNCRYTVVLVVLLKSESRKTPFCASQVFRVALVYVISMHKMRYTGGNEEVDRRRCFLNTEYGRVLKNEKIYMNIIIFNNIK